MRFSKLDLSPLQRILLTDAAVWRERRLLHDALMMLLGDALGELKKRHHSFLETKLPAASLGGKISRGENYRGFPYVLLDYPNHFSKDEIVAARNLIWFGHGMHCTLHVKGSLIETVLKNLSAHAISINVCTSDNEWLHHVNEQDWTTDLNSSLHQQIKQQSWIKLGCSLNDDPTNWHNELIAVYEDWATLLR